MPSSSWSTKIAQLDRQKVAAALANYLTQQTGIHLAISRSDAGTEPDSALLGMSPSASAQGTILTEVFERPYIAR